MIKIAGFALPLLAASLSCAAPALADHHASPDKPPMTAEDLVTMPRVGSVTASGDGRFAVYGVVETDGASFERRTVWYLRDLTDLAAEAVRLELGDATGIAFGPDNWLYFISDRPAEKGAAGTAQVWRAALEANGNITGPVPVTQLPAPVDGFTIAPTGDRIIVYGTVARSCEDYGCEAPARHLPGPGTGRLYSSDTGFVRHWDHWETPGTYNRAFVFALEDGKAVGPGRPLDGPAIDAVLTGDTPTRPFGGGEDIAWASDGTSAYFVARQADAGEPRSTNLDIWWSALDGSAPTNLTDANEATDALPAPSPDGRWLAWAAMARPGYEADRMVIQLRNLATGETRALTQAFDRSFGSLAWTADSRYLLGTAQDVLDTPLFRIDPATGTVERLDLMAGNEAHIGTVIPLPGERILFTRDSVGGPPELFLAQRNGQAEPLTQVSNAKLGAQASVVTRRFSFAGADGATVWGQIHKPEQAEGKLPVILYVHGGPQGSFNDSWSSRWNPRVVASQGYAVVSVDFHGSTGYGQAFTDAINRDWGGKPLEDLQKGLAAALALDPQIDGTRACAMGASYGGYMMNWIAGQWPERFDCLVQHDGIFDQRAMYYETEELWFVEWEHGGKAYHEDPAEFEKWNPVNHVDKWQTPMLVITGEKDFRIPYTQGLASFTALQRKGIPAELLVFPDENHWVLKPKNSLQWHQTVFAWLDRWLRESDSE